MYNKFNGIPKIRFRHASLQYIEAPESVYLPWLICKIISEWKFGWTIWYHRSI